MASSFSLLIFLILVSSSESTTKLGLNLHHRFSDEVRRWSELRSRHLPGGWLEKGTAGYYSSLHRHDRGRLLAAGDGELAFANGNVTFRFNNLGFLHYALVSLGSPNVTFLVALDTGSELFWVPCDCTSCASTKSGTNGFNFDFSIYSPSLSSTSQGVPCSSSFCDLRSTCSDASSQCPYNVEYVSADTSSSGLLVKDLLYLTMEDTSAKVVKAPIIFGCGQVQTGSFLDAAAPNGLLGLGMEKVSVPSTLASSGITSNSFSMCFGRDGIGRIIFGDNGIDGSSDQAETPFNIRHPHSMYNISITGISVGNSSMNEGFSALVDSGTSFTYLADPAYTSLSTSFSSQVHDKRFTADSVDSRIPFENCYHISSNETLIQLPDLSFATKGGSQFPIIDPIVIMTMERTRQSIYCLAIIKSNQLNIIGQNFLTGLRVVFDRERMILGWKQFNCYDVEDANPFPVNPRSTFGPTSSYTPEATKEKGSNGTTNRATGVTVLDPGVASSQTSLMNSFASIIMVFLLLAIL